MCLAFDMLNLRYKEERSRMLRTVRSGVPGRARETDSQVLMLESNHQRGAGRDRWPERTRRRL